MQQHWEYNSSRGNPMDDKLRNFIRYSVPERLLKVVRFTTKSLFQKDDCLSCGKAPSTVEAVYKEARIRCCEDPQCKHTAAKLAIYYFRMSRAKLS